MENFGRWLSPWLDAVVFPADQKHDLHFRCLEVRCRHNSCGERFQIQFNSYAIGFQCPSDPPERATVWLSGKSRYHRELEG